MLIKNLKISQKLMFGFGLVSLLITLVLGYTYINYFKEAEAVDINFHTYQIIGEADGLLEALVSMETGARGYVITGEETFLQPYYDRKVDFDLHYNNLKQYTVDNPIQQNRLINLKSNLDKWLEWETSELIEGRKKVLAGQMEMEELIRVVQSAEGKNQMDVIRSILHEIRDEEEQELAIRNENLKKLENQTLYTIIFGGLAILFMTIVLSIWIVKIVVTPVKTVTNTFKDISEGDADLEVRLKENSRDELGDMARYFNIFMTKLYAIIQENKNQSWLKTGQSELHDHMRGELSIDELGTSIINHITKYVDAKIGAIYIKTSNNTYNLSASYAYKWRKNLSSELKIGEGLIGQAVLEKKMIILTSVPEDYIKISSGVGEAAPRNIVVIPCIYNDDVKCVIELGSFEPYTEIQLEFLEKIAQNIAISLHTADVRIKMQELLIKTLQQSEEVQVQQEELRQSNEELEVQTKALKESESQLQSQQEELRVINEELEERTKTLELQRNDVTKKNDNLIKAHQEIEEKALALETASKYKSEFLANMSHELRTPLNSIIVLSQMLSAKNDNTPLTDKQLEFASTILSSGQDLLKLINDILDLSKVEAGKIDIIDEKVNLESLVSYVERAFRPIANNKDLELKIFIDKGMPESILSDGQRVQQIINNLFSNAFKFTHLGGVTMRIGRPNKSDKLDIIEDWVCFEVTDTGIGIPLEKQKLIFEAFKQSDGTTNRRYGGTGLGLSISKELAHHLGGKIDLTSIEGEGSTFTLLLPDSVPFQKVPEESTARNEQFSKTENNIKDDRQDLQKNEKSILIIEDDYVFSNILSDLAHEKGYKCISAYDGASGFSLAIKHKPSAIILDIELPDLNGWKLIEMLNKEPLTERIPVHVISGGESKGHFDEVSKTIGYIQKPVSLESLEEVFSRLSELTHPFKKLLIVDKNENELHKITESFYKQGVHVKGVDSGTMALELIEKESFDCIVIDLQLEDISGLELLEKINSERLKDLTILVHTDKTLSPEEDLELRKYVESIIIKGSHSIERLVAEASLFLHDVDSKIEESVIKAIRSDQEKEASLKNKKILIVDDDMRNVFALSSVLEEKGIHVIVGRNGKEAMKKLDENNDIDLIIMDIMMPEMDGYTAMREIRRNLKFWKLPIIALTAKAMKDDKQKCIEAGANDYLTKPIEIDRLLTLLRVWLYK